MSKSKLWKGCSGERKVAAMKGFIEIHFDGFDGFFYRFAQGITSYTITYIRDCTNDVLRFPSDKMTNIIFAISHVKTAEAFIKKYENINLVKTKFWKDKAGRTHKQNITIINTWNIVVPAEYIRLSILEAIVTKGSTPLKKLFRKHGFSSDHARRKFLQYGFSLECRNSNMDIEGLLTDIGVTIEQIDRKSRNIWHEDINGELNIRDFETELIAKYRNMLHTKIYTSVEKGLAGNPWSLMDMEKTRKIMTNYVNSNFLGCYPKLADYIYERRPEECSTSYNLIISTLSYSVNSKGSEDKRSIHIARRLPKWANAIILERENLNSMKDFIALYENIEVRNYIAKDWNSLQGYKIATLRFWEYTPPKYIKQAIREECIERNFSTMDIQVNLLCNHVSAIDIIRRGTVLRPIFAKRFFSFIKMSKEDFIKKINALWAKTIDEEEKKQ